MVTTGINALRSTCLNSTVRSGKPLARAVRTKSSLRISNTLARVMRERIAASAVPRVIAGSASDSHPSLPPTGNHSRCSENSQMSSGPSQKLGIDTPTSATSIETLSKAPYCLTAASTPIGMAINSATSIAASDSSTVGPRRSSSTSRTGLR